MKALRLRLRPGIGSADEGNDLLNGFTIFVMPMLSFEEHTNVNSVRV